MIEDIFVIPSTPTGTDIWTLCAKVAESRALVDKENAEFWVRLAGSLRKAAQL